MTFLANSKTRKPPNQALKSAFYIGKIFHKRCAPKVHQFTYPLYMMLVDLDEVEQLHHQHWWFSNKRWAPLELKESDYFKGIDQTNAPAQQTKLKQKSLLIAQNLGADISNITRVAMLAQLRCFGIYFSPVNFFFLYQDETAKYLLAEVSNTPWNKKHCYLIDLQQPQPSQKCFHVSPFMDLNMDYHWQIQAPDEHTSIGIENWRSQELLFSALFSAKKYSITTHSIFKVLLQWPLVSLSILKGIYWQASKLFIKGVPYISPTNSLNINSKRSAK